MPHPVTRPMRALISWIAPSAGSRGPAPSRGHSRTARRPGNRWRSRWARVVRCPGDEARPHHLDELRAIGLLGLIARHNRVVSHGLSLGRRWRHASASGRQCEIDELDGAAFCRRRPVRDAHPGSGRLTGCRSACWPGLAQPSGRVRASPPSPAIAAPARCGRRPARHGRRSDSRACRRVLADCRRRQGWRDVGSRVGRARCCSPCRTAAAKSPMPTS